ncbi:MAG TPA: hypothetical protein VML55_07895 [Planctomycetaceae bacterium]|nr:hypothetical protein [Planctomycetaceae bacterium]
MFRCQKCDTVVPQGVRSQKIVVQTRTRQYAARGTRPSEWRPTRRRFPVARTQPYDKGGEGTEIVKELLVCPACARELGGR